MSVEIKVPTFPESVVDGTVATWHKSVGDHVKRDEVLVDIETDKVVFDVPATESGVLEKIFFEEGATVESGELLAIIGAADMSETTSGYKTQSQSPAASVDVESAASKGVEPAINPAAKRLLEENAIDIASVTGSGKGGRILKEDVLKQVAAKKSAESPEPPARVQNSKVDTPPLVQADEGSRPQKRVPMTRLRARIAERLLEAQSNAAILTTFNEVNMQPVMDLRAKYREPFEKEHGIRLGFMSFFVAATVEALKQHPEVNASIDGNDVVYHGFFDIGIAVSSPRGLVVPILRDADQKSMAMIEKGISDYASAAKDGSLSIEDMTGGTFTITNGGIFGSLLSTPILNPPQSAILGMHKIQPKPVVENNEIVIRPMMYLAMSYDHRIIDGKEAVTFLVTIKELLEDPARILLEI